MSMKKKNKLKIDIISIIDSIVFVAHFANTLLWIIANKFIQNEQPEFDKEFIQASIRIARRTFMDKVISTNDNCYRNKNMR